MKIVRIVSGALAALTFAAVLAGPVEARDRRISTGTAVALGALGGLAVGSVIASQPRPVYAAPVYAAPAPVYVAPAPVVVEPTCVTERQREWVPGWGWQVRERTVCN